MQALVVSIVGGVVGIGLTVPGAIALNWVAAQVTGFESVVRIPMIVLLGGGAIGVGVNVLGALVAGWQLARVSPLDELDA